MTAEELRAEIRYAVGKILTYINDYAERIETEDNDTSRSYDQGVIHGCYHALSYIRRLAEDEDPGNCPADLSVPTLDEYYDG